MAYCDGKEWNGTKPECLGELDQVIMTSAPKCQSSQYWNVTHFSTIFFVKFILFKLKLFMEFLHKKCPDPDHFGSLNNL